MALVCLAALILPALNSCKKETADVGDLLSTVPSSAGAVVGFDLTSILEKAGCKVNGSDITPGKEVTAWIERQKDVKDSEREVLKLILNGESGVDPSGAIFFTDAYNSYVTVMLADTKKFTDFVESRSGNGFADGGNDVRSCGNVAVKGAQAWVCVSSDNTIDTKAVANYSTLSPEQSFASNGFASTLTEMKTDIVGWGEIKSLLKTAGAYRQMSTVSLVGGMLFDDASSFSFNVDFRKGSLVSSLSVLNSKGTVAKYLLPAEKIDLATLKSIATTAQAFGAVCITKDLVKKIENIASSLGGSSFTAALNALKPIDGTVAVAFSDIDSTSDNLSGVVTTDGTPTLDLLSAISSFAPTRKDGKLVRFSKGTVSGGLDVQKCADLLKGATMGFVMDMPKGGHGLGDEIRTLALAFVPESGGMKLDMTMEGADQSVNILLAIIAADGAKEN